MLHLIELITGALAMRTGDLLMLDGESTSTPGEIIICFLACLALFKLFMWAVNLKHREK